VDGVIVVEILSYPPGVVGGFSYDTRVVCQLGRGPFFLSLTHVFLLLLDDTRKDLSLRQPAASHLVLMIPAKVYTGHNQWQATWF